jgi:hypothetical protein
VSGVKDETYVFIQDNKEKKAIARSSHNRRSHRGKGGSIRFPSDKLTRKELEAMNGEVKTYKMNEPMTWVEFISMPDDLKISYIKALREKFGLPDKYIAEDCFNVHRKTLTHEVLRLGIGVGRGGMAYTKNWDKASWCAWLGKTEEIVEAEEEPIETIEERNEPFPGIEEITPEISTISVAPIKTKAIPLDGTMQFEGVVIDILESVYNLLGGSRVHISLTWSVLPEERA